MAQMGPLNISRRWILGQLRPIDGKEYRQRNGERDGGRRQQRTSDETLVKRLVGQVLVMLLEMFLGGGDQLHGDELIAALLETRDNVADEAALDAVRLDGDETGIQIMPQSAFTAGWAVFGPWQDQLGFPLTFAR